jgi:hypothetical protein
MLLLLRAMRCEKGWRERKVTSRTDRLSCCCCCYKTAGVQREKKKKKKKELPYHQGQLILSQQQQHTNINDGGGEGGVLEVLHSSRLLFVGWTNTTQHT